MQVQMRHHGRAHDIGNQHYAAVDDGGHDHGLRAIVVCIHQRLCGSHKWHAHRRDMQMHLRHHGRAHDIGNQHHAAVDDGGHDHDLRAGV
eukprot:9260174-Pyramimonas_sp.AAC.1